MIWFGLALVCFGIGNGLFLVWFELSLGWDWFSLCLLWVGLAWLWLADPPEDLTGAQDQCPWAQENYKFSSYKYGL